MTTDVASRNPGDQFTFSVRGKRYTVDLGAGIDCALPLDFAGPQPLVFGGSRATATPMRVGTRRLSVADGAPVNVSVVQINPHCNGTHTESTGHLVDPSLSIQAAFKPGPVRASVISVSSHVVLPGDERLREDGTCNVGDRIITRRAIETAIDRTEPGFREGLVVRIGAVDPLSDFDADLPPYLAADAAIAIRMAGVHHLVVPIPSVDRLRDDGRLAAHRGFFGMDDRSTPFPPNRTITELARIPAHVPDGSFLLDLHLPAWLLDAAPSRPVLYPVHLAP